MSRTNHHENTFLFRRPASPGFVVQSNLKQAGCVRGGNGTQQSTLPKGRVSAKVASTLSADSQNHRYRRTPEALYRRICTVSGWTESSGRTFRSRVWKYQDACRRSNPLAFWQMNFATGAFARSVVLLTRGLWGEPCKRTITLEAFERLLCPFSEGNSTERKIHRG